MPELIEAIADGATPTRLRRGRYEVDFVFIEIALQIDEAHSGLNDHVALLGVDLYDLVHALEVEDH